MYMKISGWIKIAVILVGVMGELKGGFPAAAFSISPTKYVITVDPGTTRKLTLEVVNTETERLLVKPMVIGVKQTTEGRSIFENGSDAAERWFNTLETGTELAPQARHVFTYELTVPKDVAPGSHYVGLVAESMPRTETGGTVLRGQLVSVVTIQVAGIAHEEVRATTRVNPTAVVGEEAFTIKLGLENKGNIEVPLRGKIRIESPWTDDAEERTMALGNELFAQTSRQLTYQLGLPSPWFSFGVRSASFNTTAVVIPNELNTDFSSLFRWPGKYTATIEITYGKTNQTIVRTLSVWYCPWWSIVGGFLMFSLLVATYCYLRRLFGRYHSLR